MQVILCPGKSLRTASQAGRGSARRRYSNRFHIIQATVTFSSGFSQGFVFPPVAQDTQLPPPSGKEAGKGSPDACSWQLPVPRPLVLSRGRMQEMGGGQANARREASFEPSAWTSRLVLRGLSCSTQSVHSVVPLLPCRSYWNCQSQGGLTSYQPEAPLIWYPVL